MSERSGYFLYFLLLTGILVATVVWTPSEDGPSVCPVKNLTGVSCPGCGLTRSVTALGKGDLDKSLKFHALGPLFLAIILFLWGLLAWSLIRGKPMPSLTKYHYPAIVLLVALISYWVFRCVNGTLP